MTTSSLNSPAFLSGYLSSYQDLVSATQIFSNGCDHVDPIQFENLPRQIPDTSPISADELDDAELIACTLADIGKDEPPFFLDFEINSNTKRLFDFGAYLEKSTSQGYDRGFMKGSHNSVKLESSLIEMGNQRLLKGSLLRAEVGKEHAKMLADRYLRKAKKIDAREAVKQAKLEKMNGRPYKRSEPRIRLFSTYQSFRFLTILHKVVNLCPIEAVNSVKQMKHQLKEAFSQVSGVYCLGAFEIEVTCRKKMRETCDRTLAGRKKELASFDGIEPYRLKDNDKCTEAEEFRKLTVLESMGDYLNDSLFSDEPSELLIHCHLVVCAPSNEKFDEIYKVLYQNPIWNKESRQIVMTSLTKQYGQKEKSVENNLRDIAAYITKGGNDWIGRKAYLRYKIKFSSGTPMTDEEIINQNWRSAEMLRQDTKGQDGIKDLLSLSVLEINVLAESIDEMMNLEPNGKGYLFIHGRW